MLKFLSVLALAAMSHVSLANVIYSYTGSTYTTATGVFDTTESISGQVHTAAVLADSASFYTISDFTSFSFSNGQTTFTDSPSSPYLVASIALKIVGGVVDTWSINFIDNLFPGTDTANPPRNVLGVSGNLFGPGIDTARFCPPPASNNAACSLGQTSVRGTWLISQSSPAPAPATLVLLAAGLLATRLIGTKRSQA